MKTFKDIFAWQVCYQLTLTIYESTAAFPKNEEFGLKSQIRRAGVSIISNIAEGFKKTSLKERLHFYKIAESSLEEVKCQSMLANDLKYFENTVFNNLCQLQDRAGQLLFRWMQSQK